ncbi:hypothetical protein B4U37_06300 [Sutcliffiella horikoshii]|uniref:Uncharacterized protein n=1 Tax=Sutcliffiella horikoshii TaxID=79883 RepID=A0ABN4ZC15_9BACI|nr:hypothetical protein [Sutcliffiella horikoshii]ART75661.1 hypothetical protein B4U37_06300 [Sutcliffiella horikoshii]
MIGYFIVLWLIIGFIFIFASANKKSSTKRTLFGNYLFFTSLVGFLISFILNILIYFEFIKEGLFTGNNTANSCTAFIVVALIAKYLIVRENNNPQEIY